MKLVRFLKPSPQHSANLGEEMAFDDATASALVAKGRAEFIVVAPLVVKLEAEPEIVGKVAEKPQRFREEDVSRLVDEAKLKDADRELAAVLPKEGVARSYLEPESDPEPEPERRGPGRPRKHF